MPVDNKVIVEKIQALNAKSAVHRKELLELDRIHGNLDDILDMPDPSDKMKVLRRVDRRTNAKFTDTARQKIYDQALLDVTAALGS